MRINFKCTNHCTSWLMRARVETVYVLYLELHLFGEKTIVKGGSYSCVTIQVKTNKKTVVRVECGWKFNWNYTKYKYWMWNGKCAPIDWQSWLVCLFVFQIWIDITLFVGVLLLVFTFGVNHSSNYVRIQNTHGICLLLLKK